MKNTIFLNKLLFSLLVLLLISCDSDYNTIGSDIIGNENFSTGIESINVTAFNQKTGPVQTNNLTLNRLGVYIDDVFGKTEANFVTQLSLTTLKPTFTSHVVIDSVVLNVPYFSKLDRNGKYVLDSIYPKQIDKQKAIIDLRVYENGFFLNDYDSGMNLQRQRFYSNQDPIFNQFKKGINLNKDSIFLPSNKEYIKFKVDPNTLQVPMDNKEVESRSAPSIRLHLNVNEFKKRIIDPAKNSATATNFETDQAFKNYYRGLYLKAKSDSESGTMMSLDFRKGNVTIYYKQDKEKIDENLPIPPVENREMKNLILTMSGNTVNLFNNSYTQDYFNGLNNANPTSGDQTLYVKGGEGSTVFIDIPSTKIAELKKNNWLINNASLTFTIDKSKMGTKIPEPQRVYLYNVYGNRPLIDYIRDESRDPKNSKLNKLVHGGIIEKESGSGGRGIKYKIRITEHINNIINKDSANYRLGLVVTEDINNEEPRLKSSLFLKDVINFGNDNIFTKVPISSVVNPFGTIFYGSNALVAEDKKVKLEIHYTKPN
jgi:hypothetical protein